MLNYKPTLVAALNEILPTYYELSCDSDTEQPCITFIENNNYSVAEGDGLRYSRISYIIKIWGDDIGVLCEYAVLLDDKMKELGFNRISSNELVIDTQCQKVFIYEGLAQEYTNKGDIK